MTQERHPGDVIKNLRETQQLSLEELAERCQLEVEFIAHIEQGRLFPSLAPLMKIARALGVRLGTFLDGEEGTGPVLVRQGQASDVMRFTGSGAQKTGTLDFYSLGAAKSDRNMEPFLIDVCPSDDTEPVLSSHEGEEFLYVLAGTVRVVLGRETYLLQEGDSIYYDSIVPHEVRAGDGAGAKLLAVVYAPF
ncbi:MAG: helix-turn-helix domain-containing protein [Candidatus Hydrogenedens sp.]|jgi:transcriptional regulator with XRE-family HTH domain|nr:helix-turn-helix domain-containing protein [Candidatus Hydrogenedens sp.]